MTVDDSKKDRPQGDGFISLEELLQGGVDASIPSGLKGMDESRLYDKLE